jgi:hypothetical protein
MPVILGVELSKEKLKSELDHIQMEFKSKKEKRPTDFVFNYDITPETLQDRTKLLKQIDEIKSKNSYY